MVKCDVDLDSILPAVRVMNFCIGRVVPREDVIHCRKEVRADAMKTKAFLHDDLLLYMNRCTIWE
jgi:hypothetical protein